MLLKAGVNYARDYRIEEVSPLYGFIEVPRLRNLGGLDAPLFSSVIMGARLVAQ